MSWMESQIETRAKLDVRAVERAYQELATSVSNPRRAPAFTVDDIEQADGAARTCLKYLGVDAGDAPATVTNIDERIEWICRPSGTMFRKVRLEEGWYKNAFGALLARLDTGEAIALLPRGVRGYYYLEPGSGRKVRVNRQTASHIVDDAVFFYKSLPARPCTLRDLIAFIADVFDSMDYLLVVVAALAATLIGLLPARVNQIAFGTVVPSQHADLIAPLGALLVGVMVSSALIGASRNLVMARVSTKLQVSAEAATFARVLMLPTKFFKEYSSGNLANRTANVPQLVEAMTSIMLGAGLTVLLSLVYIFQIGAYTPVLMLPALLIVVAEALVTIIITAITRRYEKATMEESAKLSGTVTALLNGIQKIKLAGAEDRAFARWAHNYAPYAKAAYNRPAILRALPALITLIGLVGTAAIYYFAGTEQVSVADYMAFNVAFGQMTAAVMAFATIAGQIAQIRPMLEMISPILEATPEIAIDKPCVEELSGEIEMSGVSFRYNAESPYIVQNLSFKIKSGEYVGIVGKSGSGKSTIMRLLLGFETPERGSIFYGSNDVAKIDLRSLRQHIGTVMQDGKLFMGDLANNITISSPNATLDDAWEAAELAGIANDIRKMPMGMQTIVTEGGGGISGGQRQRIMIARAICGKRRILMFDEATSALDNKTQKHVSDSLDSLNCTRIVIAHRLSTVRHCDRILVVDGGGIAEEGTYEELIAHGGVFAELVERQQLETDDS